MSRRLSPRLARLFAAVLVVGGCGVAALQVQGCADKAPPPVAPEPVLVGVSFGLSASFETFAAPLRDAIRAAEGTINSNGGVLGRPIRFEIVDDQSDTGAIVQRVANDFVAKKVAAVIGPLGSQQVVASHEIYQRARIVQISPSATSTDLKNIQDPADRFFFRTTPDDALQGKGVVLFARRGPYAIVDAGPPASPDGGPAQVNQCKKLAIVNIDSSYGTSMAAIIKASYPGSATDEQLVLDETIPDSNNQDFAAVAAKVVAANPDCLAFISYDDVSVPFLKELKKNAGYAALDARGFFLIGTDGSYTSGFLENSREIPSDETSPNSAAGVYGTNPDTTPTSSTEYGEFKSIFAAYGPLVEGETPAFAANTFDAAILIALAVQKAKTSTDGVAIRNALRDVAKRTTGGRSYSPAQIGDALIAAREGQNIDYRGASGSVDFDEFGNVNAGFIIWRAVRDPQSNKVSYKTLTRFSQAELEREVRSRSEP